MIEQGVEIERRSVIETSARLRGAGSPGGQAWEQGSYVRVGGCTVLVGEGRMYLP